MKRLIFSLVLASIVLVSSCNGERYELLTRINVEQDKEGKLIDTLLANLEQSIKAKSSNNEEEYLRLDSVYDVKRRELDSISKVRKEKECQWNKGLDNLRTL